MSATSPVSPVDHRDIRSASQPFKRDKEHNTKWANGSHHHPGVWSDFNGEPMGKATDEQRAKIRPVKKWTGPPVYHKHTANRSPKPSGHSLGEQGKAMSRYAYQVDAQLESDDHTKSELSKSLFDLLPQHANNTDSPIQTALRSKSQDGDVGILYSFDNKGPSPGEKGRQVDLGGLVEKAEQKWVAQQTDRLVRGEYEVLDEEGETMTVSKSKFKKSPKQKAIKSQPSTVKGLEGEEDDGFELI